MFNVQGCSQIFKNAVFIWTVGCHPLENFLLLFFDLVWILCPEHAALKENIRANRLADKATITSGMHLGRSELLRSLGHHLLARSHRHHTADRLEEMGVERGSARRPPLRGRKRVIVNQTNVKTVSKANTRETFERRYGAHMGFSEGIDTILS